MRIILIAFVVLTGLPTTAQNIIVSKALFKQGDDMNWAKPVDP